MSMDINISYTEFVASNAFPKLCSCAAKTINNMFLTLPHHLVLTLTKKEMPVALGRNVFVACLLCQVILCDTLVFTP